MAFSVYSACVPVLVRGMTNLSALLAKGEAYVEARKIDPATLIGSRLALDMYPLARQIQIASDGAKGGAARLAGVAIPSWPDTESTVAELQARIAKTIEFLQGLNPEQFDGAETRDIVMKFPDREITMTGQDFLLTFVLPNFMFHVTTAYAILRHNGVGISKRDYLGA